MLFESGVVLRVGVRRVAVGDKDDLVVHLHGVTRVDSQHTLVAVPVMIKRVDPVRLQNVVQIGRAGHECAEAG
jgi:hypothetical protein